MTKFKVPELPSNIDRLIRKETLQRQNILRGSFEQHAFSYGCEFIIEHAAKHRAAAVVAIEALEEIASAQEWDAMRDEHRYNGIDAGYKNAAIDALKKIKKKIYEQKG